MPLRTTVCLVAAALAPAAAAGRQPPAKEPARLKVRLEVSKQLAPLFAVKGGKVVLENGAEITLLRGCDVELVAVATPPAVAGPPRPKLPPGVVRLEAHLAGESPATLANPPDQLRLLGLGAHFAQVAISFRGLGSGNYQAQLNCKAWPGPAEWKKARLLALKELDGRMREALGAELLRPASVAFHEKPGWYLCNPYPFVISGEAVVAPRGGSTRIVPFRLEPGARGPWVAADRFTVRGLVLSAPDKRPAKK